MEREMANVNACVDDIQELDWELWLSNGPASVRK
jgi:hypothetical protein